MIMMLLLLLLEAQHEKRTPLFSYRLDGAFPDNVQSHSSGVQSFCLCLPNLSMQLAFLNSPLVISRTRRQVLYLLPESYDRDINDGTKVSCF